MPAKSPSLLGPQLSSRLRRVACKALFEPALRVRMQFIVVKK